MLKFKDLLKKRAKSYKKTAKQKFGEFAKIIDKIKDDRSLIFVSPEQREKVIELVKPKNEISPVHFF